MRFDACSYDALLRAVPGFDLNLESCDTAVFCDGDLDVLDDAVRQEDHPVLAGVERGDGLVRRHSLNVEVPATDRRDDDPDGYRFPLVAEPLNLLGELSPKEVAVEHAPLTIVEHPREPVATGSGDPRASPD